MSTFKKFEDMEVWKNEYCLRIGKRRKMYNLATEISVSLKYK